jgi:hypothetical protein
MTSWLSFCLSRSWKWRRLLFMLRWLAKCYCERFGLPLLLPSSVLLAGLSGCLRVLCEGFGGLLVRLAYGMLI